MSKLPWHDTDPNTVVVAGGACGGGLVTCAVGVSSIVDIVVMMDGIVAVLVEIAGVAVVATGFAGVVVMVVAPSVA